MKIFDEILMRLKQFLSDVSEPFMIVLKAGQKLLRGLLNTLVGAPAEAVDSVGQRVIQRASAVDSSLDARADAQKERDLKKKMGAALERLYYTDNFLIRARSVRRWKNFWIFLIELVSFATTYRGLNQFLSALHFMVPLLLAVVIQTCVGYLAAAVSSAGSTPKQKGLLLIALSVSITLSYVGVTETILPYSAYAQEQYGAFSRAYQTVKERGNLAVEAGSSPVTELGGQYDRVEQLLADADSRYSDEALEQANEELAGYESMTVPIVVSLPDRMYQDADGNWTRGSGGSRVQYVPDQNAAPMIESARAKIRFIEEQRGMVEEIRTLLQGAAARTAVTAAVERQMKADGALLPEFMEASHSVQLLREKCQELAGQMESPIAIQFNLEEILQDYRRANRLSEAGDIRPFLEVYGAWKDTQVRPADTGVEMMDATLAVITANNPAQLKEQLDQEVETVYGTLLSALKYVGEEKLAETLARAYEAYHLELPMLYAFYALRPDGEDFGIAVLAAVVAVINDGLAVLIGLWMEQKCMNWCSRRTIGSNDLMPHLYPHFRAVIMPELRKKIGWNFTFEEARDGFAAILEDYLARFQLKPLLIREGFTRCGKMLNNDSGFEKFCAFLLTWGLAKPIRPEDAKTLGLAGADDPDGQYILLSSRAEGWIIDLLGNAAELGYNELAYSV